MSRPPSTIRRPSGLLSPVELAPPSPSLPLVAQPEVEPELPTNDPYSLRGRSAADALPQREQTVALRTHEETLTKLRILEAHRAADRERIKELDRVKEEAEVWATQRPKLQAKLLEQSAELKSLRQKVRRCIG